MKKMAAPFLSTSFSENGRRAKKRFVNILDTKAKRTGAVMLILLSVLMIGFCAAVVFNEERSCMMSDRVFRRITEQPLDAEMPEIICSNEQYVTYVYKQGLYRFNISTEQLTRQVDLTQFGKQEWEFAAGGIDGPVYIRTVGTADFVCWKYDAGSDTLNKIFTDYWEYEKWRGEQSFFGYLTDTNILTENERKSKRKYSREGVSMYFTGSDTVESIRLIKIDSNGNRTEFSVFDYDYIMSQRESIRETVALFERIASLPRESDNYEDYINAHPAEVRELVTQHDLRPLWDIVQCRQGVNTYILNAAMEEYYELKNSGGK